MRAQMQNSLPVQDMLSNRPLAVMPLEVFSSELSEVPHRHDAYMLMLVEQSDGGDNLIDFRRYALEAGRIFFLRPGQAHQRAAKRETGILISFSSELLQTTGITGHDALVLFGAVYQHPYLDLPEKLQQTVRQIALLMAQELQEKEPSLPILSRLLFILLSHLLRESHLKISKLTPARYSERLFRLSNLIEQHYREHKGVGFYADSLEMTAKHLNSICRRYLGTTVADMVHERILLESKRLLSFSSLSVKEIAYELGFEDASYFVRFFKRMTGITPKQFRGRGSESTILADESPAS